MKPITFCTTAAMVALAACTQPAPTAAPAPAASAGPRAGAPPSGEPTGARGGAPAARSGAQAGGGEAHPQPYGQVVTAEAETRPGLFKVHQIGAKLLFEIPRDQLDKDQLLVTEIAKTVLGAGYGGQAVSNSVLQWQLRDDKVYLRTVSYDIVADEGTPEEKAVQSANVSPIVAAFNVEAYGADSAAVIDVTRLFTQPPAASA